MAVPAEVWIGCDPGGAGAFGVAWVDDFGSGAAATVSGVSEALAWISERPKGLGVDAPLWWSAQTSGRRLADSWVRSGYSIASGPVQTANSLRGAAVVQGPELCRLRFGDLPVTETHPKALKLDWGDLVRLYGLDVNVGNEHERDAAIGALAAREGFSGRWSLDLSERRSEKEQDPKTHWLAPVHYWWPTRDESA